MRAWISLITVLTFCSGCTHVALERRTVKQASTLSDLQYQQVLDNLAMFACNRDAMAWHVKVKGGTIQLTDSASAGFGATIASSISDSVKNLFIPSAGAQRTALQQWDVDPTIEADELESLQMAYQKAIDPIGQSGDLRDDVLRKICDVCLKFSVLPRKDTFDAITQGAEAQGRLIEAIDAQASYVHALKEPDSDKGKTALAQLEGLASVFCSNVVEKMPPGEEREKAKHYVDQTNKTLNDIIVGLEGKPPKETDVSKRVRGIRERLSEECSTDAAKRRISHLYARSRVPQVWPRQGAERATAEKQALAIAEDPKNQLLTALQIACASGYLPPGATFESLNRNPGLIDQAQDKIEALQDLIAPIGDDHERHEEPKFNQPWLCVGPKKALPTCTCYVGHYCHCGCDCYVWVTPDHMKTLRDFTLIVLKLAPPDKQDLSSVLLRGAAVGPPSR